jgi:hypothetical protein
MKRLLILPIMLVTVMAGACDARQSDDGTAGIASANGGGATSTTSAAGDARAWAACMRQHGQNVPDQQSNTTTGGVDGDAPRGAAWRRALSACQSSAPPGVERPAPSDTATLEKLREFAVCMRAHGLEMTDPDPQTGNMMIGGRFNDFNRTQAERDPTYKAALDACKDKLPDDTSKKGAER